jgi:hypothetical protein
MPRPSRCSSFPFKVTNPTISVAVLLLISTVIPAAQGQAFRVLYNLTGRVGGKDNTSTHLQNVAPVKLT